MEFNVGDRVKRIRGSYHGMIIGDVATVEGLIGETSLDLVEYGTGHDPNFFVLACAFEGGDIMPRKIIPKPMVDKVLIESVLPTSTVILETERKWRAEYEKLKNTTNILPFAGDYECLVEKSRLLIKGWSGKLIVDKFYFEKMYRFAEPFVCDNIGVYCIFGTKNIFCGFTTRPKFGAHYMTDPLNEHICLGDFVSGRIDTLEELKYKSAQLAKVLEIINAESMGAIFLPEIEKNKDFIERVVKGNNICNSEIEKTIKDGVLIPIELFKKEVKKSA